MRVGTTETETGNTGDGLAGVARPIGGLGRHLQVCLLEVDVRVRTQVVDRRGNLVFLHRQNDLDEAGGACRCLQVPEVGLRTTEQCRLVVVTATTDDTAERVGLDRITEIGTRPVCLDVVDGGRQDAGVAVRETQHVGLGIGIGCEQTVGTAVLIDRGSGDHREDGIAVTLGVFETLEHDESAALAANDSLSLCGEGTQFAVGSEHPGLVETEGSGRGQQHVDATGQRDVGITTTQRTHSLVNGNQRRRACGVQSDGRSTEVEEVRDTVSDDGRRRSGQRVRMRRRRIADREQLVVVGGTADENTDLLALEPTCRNARVLERFPRELEREALLRIDVDDLERRHREELGVEALDVVEVPALGVRVLDRGLDGGIRHELGPAVLGEVADAVASGRQHFPHVRRRVPGTGESCGQSDDGDVVRVRRAA